jgi:Tol biopolymer transport system component
MGMRRIVLLLASMALAVIFGSGVALADSPTTKEDCKKGGYAKYGFKNQGQCTEAVKLPPPAPLAPDRIVFSTTRFDGTYQLATMNPDGSDVQPITSTSGPPQEFTPAISPDRRSIAYITDANELGVVNVDGTNSILLPPPPVGANRGFPDWSPDGQTIIYTQTYPDGSGSAIMRYPGEEVVIDLPGYDQIPAWGSNNRIVWENTQQGILSANPDGSDVVVLDPAFSFVNEPEVSPDGTKVVYFNNGDICTMDTNGSNKQNLTQDFSPLGGLPAWSPDGSQITFTADQDIWVMNADGTNIHNVTNTPPGPLGVDFYPDWGVSPPS